MCKLTIENELLKIDVNQTGGCLMSVYDKEREKELMWPGDPDSWRFQDVVIFPLIGKPANGYDVDGKTYDFRLPHGVARWETYEVEEHTPERLVLRLESNEETLSRYPYHFRLRLIYRLEGKKFSLTYAVSNTAGERMPYQVGAHAGFQTAGKAIRIEFDRPDPLRNFPFDGTMHRPSQPLSPDGVLELTSELCQEKMAFILDHPCGGCTVIRGDGIKLRYQWKDAPYVNLFGYSKGGEFMCVEPWWGICESPETSRELAEKEEMYIAGAEERSHTYSCEIM